MCARQRRTPHAPLPSLSAVWQPELVMKLLCFDLSDVCLELKNHHDTVEMNKAMNVRARTLHPHRTSPHATTQRTPPVRTG